MMHDISAAHPGKASRPLRVLAGTGSALVACGLLLWPAAVGGQVMTSDGLNLYGLPGGIDTPSAEMMADGTLAGHFSLSRLSRRKQLMVELFGLIVFLMPVAVLVLALSWGPFMDAYTSGEISSNAGGLVRWPV